MTKVLLLLLFLCCGLCTVVADVLIVADEIPAMERLARQLKAAEGIQSVIVKQTDLPPDLAKYSAVIVYIHKALGEPAEKAFIDYAQSGGKLILLHHSISSGKRSNRYWFPFLKISLLEGDFSQGGYKWIEGVRMELVNLAPKEYITTHKVKYGSQVMYQSSDRGGGEKSYPGFLLEDTEVYLNHVFKGPRTILMGVKYTDAKSGKTYMQDRAGWYMPAGKGWVLYFMPGHSIHDFENPVYAQILTNAVTFQPSTISH